MPKIDIYRRQLSAKPVGRGQLSPNIAATGEEAIGAGLGVIGQGIGDVGGILFQLRKEQLALADSISEAKADALIQSSGDDFKNFRATNDLLLNEGGFSNWEEENERSLADLRKGILNNPDLPLSRAAKARMGATLTAYGQLRNSGLRLAQTKALQENGRSAVTVRIEKALESGNDLLISRAIKAFEENKQRLYGTEQSRAEADFKSATRKGLMQQVQNQAVLDPERTLRVLTEELNLRKEGRHRSAYFRDYLPNESDVQALVDYTQSIINKRDVESERAASSAIEEAYGQITGGVEDVTPILDSIRANTTIRNKDAVSAIDKITTFFTKWNTLEKSVTSDDAVYDLLTEATESVERGAMSPAEFEELFVENKGKLTVEDQRAIRSKDVVATRTMQNSSFSQITTDNRPYLVEVKEDELSALISARNIAVQLKDIKTVNALNFGIKKAQAQKWNYGRYRTKLRSLLADNPEWSMKQIYSAGMTLLSNYDLNDAELLLQFDNYNPKESLLLSPPDDRLKEMWKDLTKSDKAKIWEIRLRGGSIDEILGAVE